MAKVKTDFNAKINSYILIPASKAYTKLESHWNDLGRKVHVWADDNLTDPWRTVAKKIFDASLIALGFASLPLGLSVVAAAAFYVAHISYGPFEEQTFQKVFTGVSVGSGLVAAARTIALLTTGSPAYLIGALFYGAISYAAFSNSNIQQALQDA